MAKHNKVIGIFPWLVMLAAMAIVLNFSDLKSQSTLYVTKIDLAKEIFSDQIERVVFVTADLKIYVFNSGEIGKISGQRSQVYEEFKKDGIKIEDIGIITHNHFSPKRFTPADNRTEKYFRDKGFRGLFSIYYPATEGVRVKKDE